MLGYTIQADWKKENATHVRGTEFMQANCAQCHKDKNFAGNGPRSARPRTFLQGRMLRVPPHSRRFLRHARPRSDAKLARSGSSTISGVTSSILAHYPPTSVMPQFKLTDDDKQGARHLPQESPRAQSFRLFS